MKQLHDQYRWPERKETDNKAMSPVLIRRIMDLTNREAMIKRREDIKRQQDHWERREMARDAAWNEAQGELNKLRIRLGIMPDSLEGVRDHCKKWLTHFMQDN